MPLASYPRIDPMVLLFALSGGIFTSNHLAILNSKEVAFNGAQKKSDLKSAFIFQSCPHEGGGIFMGKGARDVPF